MIIYENTAKKFRDEVDSNQIVDKISERYSACLGRIAPIGEMRAWNNSMRFMETVVRKANVADDCGILIEFNIPTTSKRIDFVIAGEDEKGDSNFVIVELKQWDKAEATEKEDLVVAYVAGKNREVAHPSYQAYSYKKYLSDMNEGIYGGNLRPFSCAYLHNYHKREPEPLLSEQYDELIKDTPVYFASDSEKLESFIHKYVGKGKGMDILYQIESGKIKPSKKFIEYVSDMFRGNEVYTLLDEQKVAYSNIVDYAKRAKDKTVIIVNGGPGTGKSVVAMNAFAALLQEGINIKFVAPNSAFREGMADSLVKNKAVNKTRIKALFSGSSVFYDARDNEFDVLICDEAHRLKKKGAYMYKGESQVDDIVKASRVSVFFVDDNQRIRPDDEGSVSRIIEVANKYGAEIKGVMLKAQFRCSGAEGFLNWISHTLQIEETANFDGWDDGAFVFELFDNPNDVYDKVKEKNDEGFKARMLAGFAWPWTSDKDGNANAEVNDVDIPECGFSMPWNSRTNQNTWATDDRKQNQIGCVHTSQGLEFDYVGVIIGNDLKFKLETMEVVADYDEYYDTTGKKGMKFNPEELTRMIKNIYKVLLSRGMKGCFVYCRNPELREYLRSRFEVAKKLDSAK